MSTKLSFVQHALLDQMLPKLKAAGHRVHVHSDCRHDNYGRLSFAFRYYLARLMDLRPLKLKRMYKSMHLKSPYFIFVVTRAGDRTQPDCG
jgi:hypothetical protein